MKKMHVLAGLLVVFLLTSASAFAEVKVSMHDGRVTIVAKDATLRQILTEWARVGQTKIVNVERVPGGPMTLELTEMPEPQALDLLLRSVSGYMAAARPTAVANLSQFDRVVVMATSAAPRQALSPVASSPAFPQPQFNQPQPSAEDDADDQRPAQNVPMPNGAVQNPRGPVFNTFPQPQVVNPQMPPSAMPGVVGGVPQAMPQAQMPQHQVPQQQAPAGAYPTAPFGGVAIPGMVVQPPQQPGQIQAAPPQTGQPVRRPGGGPQGQ